MHFVLVASCNDPNAINSVKTILVLGKKIDLSLKAQPNNIMTWFMPCKKKKKKNSNTMKEIQISGSLP